MASVLGLSRVFPDGSLLKTAEYQLLLSTTALLGIFLGLFLCVILERKNAMMLGFSGYRMSLRIWVEIRADSSSGVWLDNRLCIRQDRHNHPSLRDLLRLDADLRQSWPRRLLGLLSSESYATAMRGTCDGFSAAVGKTGAAIGTEVFILIQDNIGKKWTFIFAAICGVGGVLATWIFVKDVRGDDLANEDEQLSPCFVSRGWIGEMDKDGLQAVTDKGIPTRRDGNGSTAGSAGAL